MAEIMPWKIDVNVLCIFFAREDAFQKCFDAVKKARPRRLLLWQDGPRENRPDDMEHILKCREIAEQIDWDCEVYRCYNEHNYGCDPSTFYSHKWAFSIVDKCIILEDDFVASQDFFKFCKEMLDRYENDQRIYKICGMCQVEDFDCPDSYFFSTVGSPGWATWKRVADEWDENYSFLKDEYAMNLVRDYQTDKKAYKDYEKTCFGHSQKGVPYWETIQTYSRCLNSQLNILPSKNLIKNIGLGEGSTHSNTNYECIPRKLREVFYCDTEALEFPLKHPKYVIENIEYKDKLYKVLGKNNPLVRFRNKTESILLRLRHLGLKYFIKRFLKK